MKDKIYKYRLVVIYLISTLIFIFLHYQTLKENINAPATVILSFLGNDLEYLHELRENIKLIISAAFGAALTLTFDEIKEIWKGNRDHVAPPDYSLTHCNEKSEKILCSIQKKVRSLLYRDACKLIGDELDSFIVQEKHNKRFIYFLRGESGVGKSTLLASKAEEWRKSNHIVAYVSDVSIEDKNFTFCSTILDFFIKNNRQGSIENLFKKLNSRFNKKKLAGKKFILIIDGINKSCDPIGLFSDFLRNYTKLFVGYPWFRVIISMNNEFILTYKDRFVGDEKNLLLKEYLYIDNLKYECLGTELQRLSREECGGIYAQLKKQKIEEKKDNNSATDWDKLPESIQKLLDRYEFIYLFFSKISETTEPIEDIYSLMNWWKEGIYKKYEGLKMAVSTIVEQLVENIQYSYIDDINKEDPYMLNAISCMKKELILTDVVYKGELHCDFSPGIIADVFFAEYIQNKITDEQGNSNLNVRTILVLDNLKCKTTKKLLNGLIYYLKESISKLKNYISSEAKANAIEVIFESLRCLDYQLPPKTSYLFAHGYAQSAYEIRALFEFELENIDHPRKDEFFSYNSYQISLALIRIGQHDEAIHRLKNLSKQEVVSKLDTNFKVAIEVYLALAYISKCEYSTAEKILENIVERNSSVESSRLGNLGAAILWQLKPNFRIPFSSKYIKDNKKRFKKVREYFNSAIALSKKNNDMRSLAFWSCYYGYYVYLIGNKDDAINIFEKHKKLCETDRHGYYYFNSFFEEILFSSLGISESLDAVEINSPEKRNSVNTKPHAAISKNIDC